VGVAAEACGQRLAPVVERTLGEAVEGGTGRAAPLLTRLARADNSTTMPPFRNTPQPLELRPLPQVVAGFVLGPVAGLTTLWLLWIAPDSPWPSALTIWGFMIILGGLACLAVELAVVTPLLLGYRRYRWKWLNGWSAVAIAFALGAFCSLGAEVFEATHNCPGCSEWGPNGEAYVIIGVTTAAGWRNWRDGLAPGALGAGMVGGIAALVFRLVALRTEPTGDSTPAEV